MARPIFDEWYYFPDHFDDEDWYESVDLGRLLSNLKKTHFSLRNLTRFQEVLS